MSGYVFSSDDQSSWRADLSAVPETFRVDKEEYRDTLKVLQDEISIRHNALMAQKQRAIIVFEGWDAAGKGGSIKRLTADWDPRGYKVWPIAAPDEHERARHYLYRFWKRLPADGSIAIFDRSWYGRVLVERVEGFAPKPAWQRAYQEICDFERTLMDNGSHILKIFLHVSLEEQKERFLARLDVPYKRWKITEEDIRNRQKYSAYQAAITQMLCETHTSAAPWIVVPAHQKKFARLAVLSAVKRWLDNMDLDLAPPFTEAHQALKDALERQ